MNLKSQSQAIAILCCTLISTIAYGANQASGPTCTLPGASSSSSGPTQGKLAFKPLDMMTKHISTASGGYDLVQMNIKSGARFNSQEISQTFKLSFRLAPTGAQGLPPDVLERQAISQTCIDTIRSALLTGFWVGIEETDSSQGFEADPNVPSCGFRLRKIQATNNDPPAAPSACGLIPSQANAPVISAPPAAQPNQNQQTN